MVMNSAVMVMNSAAAAPDVVLMRNVFAHFHRRSSAVDTGWRLSTVPERNYVNTPQMRSTNSCAGKKLNSTPISEKTKKFLYSDFGEISTSPLSAKASRNLIIFRIIYENDYFKRASNTEEKTNKILEPTGKAKNEMPNKAQKEAIMRPPHDLGTLSP
uniref:Uncharacterized protein n=1 Tax=Romanomermis culicivorax TaxID=13658 RepID=A0A915KL86_ROMCU